MLMNFINCYQGRRVLNAKPFFLLLLVVFFLAFSTRKTKAQTTLSTGDVVFTSYGCEAAAADTFSIMLLRNIASGTKIIFTDGCWEDGVAYFKLNSATSDWLFEWQATSAMDSFSQVKFWTSTVNCGSGCGANASVGQINFGRGLGFPTSGDQVFACQNISSLDTSSAYTFTPTTVLAGLHANTNLTGSVTTASNWDDGATTSTSESELPPALTTGVNAIWLRNGSTACGTCAPTGSGEHDNARYDCSAVTGASAVRAAANDSDHWVYDDVTNFSPTYCTDVVTTWNGTTWSNGTPNQGFKAAIGSNTTPGSITAGDLYINSGFTLTLGSGVTATVYRDLTNNGNGTSGAGTLRFVKSGTQALNGNAFTHSGPVEIATGATLTTNSKLTMANNAPLMHGTNTSNGGGSVSGSITFQKTIGSTTKGWRMFGLPVDGLVDNFESGLNTLCSNHTPSGERNVYYYNAASSGTPQGTGFTAIGWTQANNSSDDENKAYSIYLDNTSHGAWNFGSTASVSGTPNDGTKTFNLEYTHDPASSSTANTTKGWNMIPNYLPSILGVYNLINDGNFGSTYKAVHVWDQGAGQMKAMNQSSLNNYNTSGGSIFSTIRQIPMFTGFWVKATGASQSIQLKNSMRITRTDSLPANTFFKKEFDVFRVTVKDADGKFDQFSVCFDDEATDGMDYTMDIYKFKSFSDEVPTLYTTVDGEDMSLNAVPMKTSYSMPLFMESFKDGKEYTFNPEVQEYRNLFDVELVDNKMGVKTQLLDKNYTFKHDASYKGARFTLNFNKKSTTSVDELFNPEKMYAYTNEGGINVVYSNRNTTTTATVEIYNIMGQKLFSTQTAAGVETITYQPAATAQTNVYVVNVTSNGKTKTIKVVY